MQARLIQGSQLPMRLRDTIDADRIYIRGYQELLDQPCIGLCGSRDASAAALQWAYSFGREAALRNVIVVSGYARGVDREAHRGALEAGGGTIAVLPEGIQHFRVARDLRHTLDLSTNFLAVSMFEPAAPWTVWRAMRRNKLIVALSSGLFVIEAREKGGTIDAAHEAIKQGKRLWAVAYQSSQNAQGGDQLLRAGKAIPLKHLDDFKAALEEAMREPPPEVRQLVMSVMTDEIAGEP